MKKYLILWAVYIMVIGCSESSPEPTSRYLGCIGAATAIILFDKDNVIKTFESTEKSLRYWETMREDFTIRAFHQSKKEGYSLK